MASISASFQRICRVPSETPALLSVTCALMMLLAWSHDTVPDTSTSSVHLKFVSVKTETLSLDVYVNFPPRRPVSTPKYVTYQRAITSPTASRPEAAMRRCASFAWLPFSASRGASSLANRANSGTVRTGRTPFTQVVSPGERFTTKRCAIPSVQPISSLSVTTCPRLGTTTCTASGNCSAVLFALITDVTESRSPESTNVGTAGNCTLGGSGLSREARGKIGGGFRPGK